MPFLRPPDPALLPWMAALFGLAVGSFLNVVIYRLPLGDSIVTPGSHCPACGHPVRVRDNIPLLSFLLLRGRCRFCEGPIGLRYPLVELASAVLFFLIVRDTGLVRDLAWLLPLAGALIAVAMIDIDYLLIPNVITYPGIALGLGVSFFDGGLTPVESALGILTGAGVLLAVLGGYYLLTRRHGMGFGDVKLLAMIGAFVGWEGVVATLLIGSFLGSAIGLIGMVRSGAGRLYKIPFGPFLAVGALVVLLAGDAVYLWAARHLFGGGAF